MGSASHILLAFLASLGLAVPARSATLDLSASKGVSWLSSQRNLDDGSWGATEAEKYVQTSEAVIALGALNQQNAAYYGGVAWLGNHAPANIDFTARRILAQGAANRAIGADLAVLQAAQNLAAPGNNGWGLSKTYQGSTLDTALTLQALNQQGVSTNVAQAVAYLTASQLTGTDSGWALGQETISDPIATAQVLIALIPQKALAGVPNAITKGFAALNAKVTAASPAPLIALAVVANLRNGNTLQGTSLLNTLLNQQLNDGSWGDDAFTTTLALRAVAAGAGKDLTEQKQTVNIPDAALRNAINAALGQGALDQITAGQLLLLTSLNASGMGITDLTGLQGAKNLQSLDVSNNLIPSFAPIASLNITNLNESGNPGYVPPAASADSGDVPTLPEWGTILLASLLLMTTLRAGRRT